MQLDIYPLVLLKIILENSATIRSTERVNEYHENMKGEERRRKDRRKDRKRGEGSGEKER